MLRRDRDVSTYWLEFLGGHCYILDIGALHFGLITVIWLHARHYMNSAMDSITIFIVIVLILLISSCTIHCIEYGLIDSGDNWIFYKYIHKVLCTSCQIIFNSRLQNKI